MASVPPKPSLMAARSRRRATRYFTPSLPYAVVPGVSAVFAAAAAINAELTVPEVAQTVILTRLPSRTTIPEQEQLRAMAAHGGTICLFLSITVIEKVVSELIAGGYASDTPAAVLHRVSWEDETIIRGTLADISASARVAGHKRQALILVGRAIDPHLRAVASSHRSNLYDPTYSHVFRLAEGRGRTEAVASGVAEREQP